MANAPSVVSYAKDIRPLFREKDVNSMRKVFDLASYDDVRAHAEAMSGRLVTVQLADELRVAEDRMQSEQVHRIPVVDARGFLKGIVTINDLARHLQSARTAEGVEPAEVAGTLAAISRPRSVSSVRAAL